LFFPVFLSCFAEEKSIQIAAGAGYKRPVLEICDAFTAKTGIKVDSFFGNMQTVTMQIKESGQVGLFIGEKSFLDNKSAGVFYSSYTVLGKGILVLAYPEGKKITSANQLLEGKTERISMPDPGKAIYGKAAFEYLSNHGYWDSLKSKIIITATVPQVSSYLIAGEVDAGFINLTEALALRKQLGGFFRIDAGYTPIEIVAGVVDGFTDNKEIRQFVDFLKTDEVRKILVASGLADNG
jgi:molybdate transport system substrate-binding protein